MFVFLMMSRFTHIQFPDNTKYESCVYICYGKRFFAHGLYVDMIWLLHLINCFKRWMGYGTEYRIKHSYGYVTLFKDTNYPLHLNEVGSKYIKIFTVSQAYTNRTTIRHKMYVLLCDLGFEKPEAHLIHLVPCWLLYDHFQMLNSELVVSN